MAVVANPLYVHGHTEQVLLVVGKIYPWHVIGENQHVGLDSALVVLLSRELGIRVMVSVQPLSFTQVPVFRSESSSTSCESN